MGRDIPDGRMFLRNGRLDIDWNRKALARPTSSACAPSRGTSPASLGGRFADNPLWFLRRVITVHPLGGAPMGRDPRARASSTRTATSSAIPACTSPTARSCPGPTGPNPSFTIAALADRFADQILDPDRRAAEAAAR